MASIFPPRVSDLEIGGEPEAIELSPTGRTLSQRRSSPCYALAVIESPTELPSVASERKTRSFSIEAAFLAASFLLALLFLGFRNIYDDEVASFDLIGDSVPNIIRIANSEDVHPPGMYVLSHFAYRLIPSPRWMTIVPLLVFYGGLAVFVFAVGPLFTSTRARVCFLLLATLHPQLLMWSNSIRWYGWWTGIALLAVTIALQPSVVDRVPALSYRRAGLLGLLFACLFYVNYITLLFIAALCLGVFLRYSWSILRQTVVALVCFALLIVPQLRPFLTVHIAGSGRQRGSLLISAARVVESISTSEAYLPWHPLAIVAVVVFLGLLVWGMVVAIRFVRGSRGSSISGLIAEIRSLPLLCILSFGFAFLGIVVLSGLGGKPRNGLLLIPVLAVAAGLLFEKIRLRFVPYALLAFYSLWALVGAAHLVGRRGVTKADMNDRPEQVLDYVRDSRGASCSVTMTYDPELTFTMAMNSLPQSMVLGYGRNSIYRNVSLPDLAACSTIELYVVRSYAGGYRKASDLLRELALAQSFISGPVRVESLNFDPEAHLKRKLAFVAGAAGLPDYRYIVSSGAMTPPQFASMKTQLHLFTVQDGVSE